MSAQVSESSITYLKDELGLTVDRVQQSLEVYAEYPESTGELTQAGDYLKQMAGVLIMLDANEGASFARELAELVDRLANDEIEDPQSALQIVLQESLKLEPFLDGLRRGSCPVEKPDLARAIDRVRDQLGKPPLNLQARSSAAVKADALNLILIRQLRSSYQHALACVFRGQEVPDHLIQMERVLAQLADTCHTRDGYQLWWTCGRLINLLQAEQLQLSPPLLRMLGAVDRQIRSLIDNGEQGYVDAKATKLSADVEACIRATEAGAAMLAERQDFDPPNVVVSGIAQSHVVPDIDTLKDVATNLADDISVLQDAIDRVARGADPEQIDISDVTDRLRGAAAILSMLNMASSANLLQQQYQRVREQSDFDATTLDRLVADLVLVEASLSALMDPALSASGVCDETNFDDPEAQLQAIKHLQARMAATEQAIEDIEKVLELTRRLHSGAEEPLWEPMAPLLHRVANVFSMLGHEQASQVSERLREIVSDAKTFKKIRDHSEYMPALAEAMVAIEYFLKAEYGLEARNPRYLNHAEECLARLESSFGTGEPDTAELHVLPAAEAGQADPEVDHQIPSESDADVQDQAGHQIEDLSVEAPEKHTDEGPVAEAAADRHDADEEQAAAATVVASKRGDDDLLKVLEAFEQDSAPDEPGNLLDSAPADDDGNEPSSFEAEANDEAVASAADAGDELSIPETAASDEAVAPTADAGDELSIPETEANDEAVASAADPGGELSIPETAANDEPFAFAADAGDELSIPETEANDEPFAFAADAGDELSIPETEANDEAVASAADAGDELSIPETAASDEAVAPTADADDELSIPETAANDEAVASAADPGGELSIPETEANDEPFAFAADAGDELSIPETAAGDEAVASAADADDELPIPETEASDEAVAPTADAGDELSISETEANDEPAVSEQEASDVLSTLEPEAGLELCAPATENVNGDGEPIETTPCADQPAWVDHEFLDIYLEEAVGEIAQLRERVPAWREDMERVEELTAIRRAFHTLKGSGRMVGAEKAGEFAWTVEDLLNRVLDGRLTPTPVLGELLTDVVAVLAELIERMLQGREDVDLTAVEAGLVEFLNGPAEALDTVEPTQVEEQAEGDTDPQAETENASDLVGTAIEAHQIDADLASRTEGADSVGGVSLEAEPAPVVTSSHHTDLDPELVEIFVQEGADILDSSDVILDRLSREPDNPELLADLRREMHTLKGSSRMAGFLGIGDLAHAFEFVLDAISKGESQFSAAVGDRLQRTLDRFHTMLAVARNMEQPEAADDLIAVLSSRDEDESSADSAGSKDRNAANAGLPPSQSVPEASRSAAADAVMLVPDASDMVRVSVDLLDKLADQMGESSIYRARISQNVSRFELQLNEMDHAITRLSEKLRRLEIETETQILFRYERGSDGDFEEFDPLELDRFSELQQLSRSLMEVVSDLNSIRSTLEEQSQGLDTLLHQQAKVNHEIQEGLTRTRMVRFDSIVPRMRRVVRQAADELGKRVDLVLEGSAEMERGLLEHIVGPLEHILRNGVSHGIEDPAKRLERGKSQAGTINLNMRREGSELILDIADDGAGVNFDAVRRKAEKAGFLERGQPSSKEQLLEVLMMPGFSTADRLTQVSGRGVGMDVVNDAVRGLGGSFSIDSERDKGAIFTLRLPFSLSITKALLVQAGGETFAVPLAGIEAMTRIASEDLRSYAEHGSGHLVYGDNHYEIHSLGALLGGTAPQGDDLDRQLPAMLVQSGGLNVAFQIDAVLGSEEIIVKPAGPQVNSVPGLAGATILGDGRVVLLLEMAALVRNFVTRAAQIEADALQRARTESGDSKLRVMVVDDSITMRKVTSRLLERQGVEALLAKDGLDAAGQLEDVVPDAVVLDIEMPRMDGYELAAHIRNQEHLWHLPIIMVTSRSGDKHRLRAMDLGVNAYLGKPYREEELVVALQRVLGDKASRLAVP